MTGIKVSGVERIKRHLKQMMDPPDSAKDAMREVGEKGLQDNYQGNPLHWKPLKPETIRRKGSARILYDKGTMSRSYQSRNTPQGMQFYNTDKPGKVKYHQGQRPHLVMRPETREEMLKAEAKEILK